MVKNDLLQQILSLSARDRERIVDVVQASLAHDLPPQLSESEQKELLRRVSLYRKHPERLLTVKQVKARLAKQRAVRSR
jgi:putative addiction module component (TIGR02574 family)